MTIFEDMTGQLIMYSWPYLSSSLQVFARMPAMAEVCRHIVSQILYSLSGKTLVNWDLLRNAQVGGSANPTHALEIINSVQTEIHTTTLEAF